MALRIFEVPLLKFYSRAHILAVLAVLRSNAHYQNIHFLSAPQTKSARARQKYGCVRLVTSARFYHLLPLIHRKTVFLLFCNYAFVYVFKCVDIVSAFLMWISFLLHRFLYDAKMALCFAIGKDGWFGFCQSWVFFL